MNRQPGMFDLMVEDPLDATPRQSVISLTDVVLFLKRRWFLIGLIAGTVFLLTGAMLTTVKPRYSATAELTLIDQRQQSTPIADLLTGVPLSRQLVQQEITTMSSKAFMIEVVKRLETESDAPFIEPPQPAILPVRLLRSAKRFVSSLIQPAQSTDAENPAETEDTSTQTAGTEPSDGTSRDLTTALAADLLQYGDTADRLGGMIQIAQRGNGYVIGVSAQSGNPEIAALVANAAATEYTRFSLDIRGDSIEEQVQLLSDRVDELGRNLEEAETAVVDFQEREMGVNAFSVDRLSRQVEDLNRRLIEARADVVRAYAQYENVIEIVSSDGAIAASDVLTSPILVSVRSELSQLRIERSRAVERFGAQSSQVSAIDAVINRISQEIEIETARLIAEYETQLEVAQNIAASINTELVKSEEAVLSRTRNMVELGKLRRIADANRIAYEEFLSIATESAQYKALQQPTVRLLSYAEVPNSPSSPRTLLILAASGLAGLAIGLGIAILIEAMNNNVKTGRQLRAVAGLPVIGSFSQIGGGKIRQLRTRMRENQAKPNGKRDKSPLTQESNGVASFLLNILEGRNGSIVVTSAVAGEGGSTVAFLLAEALAMRAESVLLVSATGKPSSFIVSTKASPELPALDEIKKTGAGFYKLSLSAATRMDPDLLTDAWKANLMKTLGEAFDYIVIDAPPVLSSSGTLSFMRDAEAVVVASRWNATPRQTIEACVQRLRDLHTENVYLVMTQVKRRMERKYEYAGFENVLKTGKASA